MKFKSNAQLILIFIIIAIRTINSCGQSNIPNYLANTVSIEDNDKKIGSGFYFQLNGKVFLVTAAHVLFETTKSGEITNHLIQDSVHFRSLNPDNFENHTLTMSIDLTQDNIVKKHAEKDICIAYVANESMDIETNKISYKPVKGVYVIINEGNFRFYSEEHLVDVSELIEGMDVLLTGYPSYLDPKPIFGTDVYNFDYPLVTGGVFSGKSSVYKNFIVSAPTYYGNSGGAVLYKKTNLKYEGSKIGVEFDFRLIGVVSSFIPFLYKDNIDSLKRENVNISNSGYSVVVPIKFAIKLMEDFD